MTPTYSMDKLFKEISYIAYHFHWPFDQIVNMEHRDRIRWCNEISQINNKINEEMKKH